MIKKTLFVLSVILFVFNISGAINLKWCYKKVFKVSAYYSPVYWQKFYYKGTYYREKKLNWNWTHWASGKRVFNWMLAAPKKYSFWTKIYFPGLWIWQVEDRWNAIVSAWKRWEKYDRIDIWVWKWDKALMRALSFWKQIRVWYVCPKNKRLKVWFDYNKFPVFANFFEKTLWWVWLFLWRHDSWVLVLQKYLKKLWYFKYNKITWYFWPITKKALIKFQKDYGIKTKYYGYFWPKTRYLLKQVLIKKWLINKKNIILKTNKVYKTKKKKNKKELVLNDLDLLKRWLWKWYKTYEVKILQKYLKKMWYYTWSIDGYYGEETIKAVSKFQFDYGIINKENLYFAWYFWPKTRTIFKKVIINKISNS